jgi:hypothetical protein
VRRAPILALAVVLLAGCGNERTPRPDIGQTIEPGTFRDVKYPELGISIKAPNRWRLFGADAPQVATIASGDAQIAIWRYPRSEPLPVDRAQLKAARKALISQVEGRDKTFDLTSSRLVIKPGLRGVELIGQSTNQGERRSVRSLHAYANGYEVVVDAFAPPRDFVRVDEQTFGPVSRSLRLSAPKP